jgi:Na+-transporting methylmalonyl-CoA/oxaloacetate decarboxylase gamma subunit
MLDQLRDSHANTDWFAWAMGAGFFGTVWYAMYHGIPGGESHDVVLMLITAVVTNYGQVVGFRYGSTSGSEKKSEVIKELAQSATVATATAAAVQAATTATTSAVPADPVKVEVTGDLTTHTAEGA